MGVEDGYPNQEKTNLDMIVETYQKAMKESVEVRAVMSMLTDEGIFMDYILSESERNQIIKLKKERVEEYIKYAKKKKEGKK